MFGAAKEGAPGRGRATCRCPVGPPAAVLALVLGLWAPLGAADGTARAADAWNGGAQRRPVVTIPSGTRLSPAAREALNRWLCPNGGAPVRGSPGRCDARRRDNRGAAPGGDASEVPGWFRDLPPARGGQAACPEGFRAVLARGHSGVSRCLPG